LPGGFRKPPNLPVIAGLGCSLLVFKVEFLSLASPGVLNIPKREVLKPNKHTVMSGKSIYITEFDLERLRKLIQEAQHTDYRKSEYLEKLQIEIDRAKVVASQDVPGDVVTMNSTVILVDLDTGEEETYTLVFPEDADLGQGKISVLAPIGTAMLGYEVGDVFEWEVPAGKRILRVEKILYQPESSGDYHL
jgi:regulator of nucleoside diphosphate kinase